MAANPPEISVCIPVYNEPALLRTVQEIQEVMNAMAIPYEILVVDDASEAHYLAPLRGLKGIRMVHHRRNLGGGVARLTGIRLARGKIVVQTDADGTYPVDRLPEMLAQMQHADMVIGARKRESATDWRWLRTLIKGLLCWIASRMAGYPIPDLNSGLRLYRRCDALRYAYLYPPGHSIMSTMTLAFIGDGLKVDFIPIDYRVREGQSSFHPVRDTYNYFLTILRTIIYFDPMRVIMPVVLVSGGLALAFSVRNLFVVATLGSMPLLLWLLTLILLVLAIVSDQFSRLSRAIRGEHYLERFDPSIDEEPPVPESSEAS